MTIRKETNEAAVEIQEQTRLSAECVLPIVTCAVLPIEGSAQLPFSRQPGPAREVDIGGDSPQEETEVSLYVHGSHPAPWTISLQGA